MAGRERRATPVRAQFLFFPHPCCLSVQAHGMCLWLYIIRESSIQYEMSVQLKLLKCSLQGKVSVMKPHATTEAPAMMKETPSSASVPLGGRARHVTSVSQSQRFGLMLHIYTHRRLRCGRAPSDLRR